MTLGDKISFVFDSIQDVKTEILTKSDRKEVMAQEM